MPTQTRRRNNRPNRFHSQNKITDELNTTPELYRVKLSCKIGRDIISGEAQPPPYLSKTEYALFNLFHAIEDIALHLQTRINTTSIDGQSCLSVDNSTHPKNNESRPK
jgi:hypothetical protein